jgi:hypothetical protein
VTGSANRSRCLCWAHKRPGRVPTIPSSVPQRSWSQVDVERDARAGLSYATGEFTWGFGLDERYPRGQFNAQAAFAEAMSEGAWSRLFNEPNLRKFVEPSVMGVDFPNVCLSQANYDVDRCCLIIATDKGLPAAAGTPTTFRVTNVDPDRCTVVADGVVSDQWRIVDGDIEVSTTVGEHTFVVRMA